MVEQQNHKRHHIGVLISSLEESCQSKVWRGIEKYARKNNIDVTAYLSTFQQKDGNLQEHYSVVFDAALQNKTIDGLIIFSGFIAEDIGTEALASFVKKCNNLPVVSLAMSFPEVPSLLVDNRSGMYDAVSHLISEHSFKNIAFVKGPEDHEEANARFNGYCDALNDGGIPFSGDRILPGHFSLWGGEEAVEELYDKRKLHVDAFACADDETAIGVIKELSRRGIRTPEDVAVVGFDDEEYAEIITPSLTTVRQPFYELGVQSIVRLIDQIECRPTASVELLPTQAVIRQSCGCVTEVEKPHFDRHTGSSYQKYILEQSMLLFPTSIDRGLLHDWINRISREISEDFSSHAFLETVDRVLIDFRAVSSKLTIWKRFFEILLQSLRNESRFRIIYPDLAEAILQAIELVDCAILRDEKYNTLKSSETQWEIRGVAQELVTSFNIESLSEKLKNGAKELDIPSVMVFLYNEPCSYSNWTRPEYITYSFGFDVDGDVREDLHQLLLPTDEINDLVKVLQHSRRTSLFYMPLFFGEEQIGIMLMGYNHKSPLDLYEAIRINVATALKGADLFEKIEHQSVTDEMTQLYNRRGFITFSLSRLVHLKRSSIETVLFFIDMDGLKKINDTHGHKAGDSAIKICAQLIEESLREEDIIGRMGGDEFTVLASQVSKQQTEDIINRLRSAFEQFNKNSSLDYSINCSVGACALLNNSENAFELALQQADELLYEEKERKKRQGLSRQ